MEHRRALEGLPDGLGVLAQEAQVKCAQALLEEIGSRPRALSRDTLREEKRQEKRVWRGVKQVVGCRTPGEAVIRLCSTLGLKFPSNATSSEATDATVIG